MCSLETTQENACESEIGKVVDELQLLRIIAQLTAELLVVASPGTEITPAAILERACTSGIGKMTDELQLLVVIAQNTCEAN